MAYQTKEDSVHDGSPLEAYKFIGTFQTYKYTSEAVQVTVNSEVYEPLAGLKRKNAKTGTQDDTSSMDLVLEMPFDTDIVQAYGYSQSPPRLTLEIRRVHRGDDYSADFVVFWKGRVQSFAVQGRIATLRVPSILAVALQGDVPNVFYQRPCNHVLYNTRCKVLRSSFNTTTSVVDVGGTTIEVAADGFADGALSGGEIVNNANGERRMILNNVTDLLTINFPFYAIEAGDSVELARGCDHRFATCIATFSNGTNFGGDPFIPGENPFIGTIG